MALREYRCEKCNTPQYVFESEEFRLSPCENNCNCKFIKMPPNPVVVHTTDTWMSEPQIDSFITVYELDRQLNIEAANERETKLMLEARKNS